MLTIQHDKDPHIIFRRWRQTGPEQFDYLLECLSDFPYKRYESSMPDIIDVGFAEPDGKVNMNRIKRKLRSKKKMKELLLRYYRS